MSEEEAIAYIRLKTITGLETLQLEKDVKAIEILLNYISKLQKENEELKERNQYLEENDWAWHELLKIQNKREYRSKFLKEFQKEFGENVLPDYDEIYKKYDKQKNIIKNSISKDKIRDKIKELEKTQAYKIGLEEFTIRVLKELLGDDDNE